MGRRSKNGTQIDRAVEKVIKEDYVSTPFIQRTLQISYLSAQKVLRQLAEMGYIEKVTEHKQMKVLKHKFLN